jgi:hypothetical protein
MSAAEGYSSKEENWWRRRELNLTVLSSFQ